MSDVPVQLIVAAFKDERTAKEALNALKLAQKEKLIKIDNAAVLRKDEKGKLHIKETADMGGKKGAALGGVAGAAIGVIAGPALLVPAAVGALVGGLAARLRDSGFSDGIIMRKINDEYYLALVIKPEGNYGKGRFVLKSAIPKLEKEF